jgi:hypothetical protein
MASFVEMATLVVADKSEPQIAQNTSRAVKKAARSARGPRVVKIDNDEICQPR